MYSKNIILSSLKESFLLIKKNKKIFFLIFALQILFFLLIVIANSVYMSKILQSTVNIIEYTESLNLDTQAASVGVLQQKSPLGEDPLLISRNYNEIKKNFTFLLFIIFMIFVLINGMIWYYSSNINKKNLFSFKNIYSYLFRFFIISLILSLFLYFMVYNSLKIYFSSYLLTEPTNFIPLLIIAIIAVYFIYIAIPILNKSAKKEIKIFTKKIFTLGTKNFITVIISYSIILILIISSLLLIFFLIELNLILLLLSFILLLLIFVWSKIYFVIVVRKLSGFL